MAGSKIGIKRDGTPFHERDQRIGPWFEPVLPALPAPVTVIIVVGDPACMKRVGFYQRAGENVAHVLLRALARAHNFICNGASNGMNTWYDRGAFWLHRLANR